MKLEDVKKLAEMARIQIEDRELEEITKDFGSILAYVDQIKEVSSLTKNLTENQDTKRGIYTKLSNILREDEDKINFESSKKEIIENMPDKQNGFLKVNKIL